MSINEHRIREFAYQIWESEGKPHGQGERHWSMACKLVQTHSEISAGNDEQPPSTEPIEPISPTQPAQPVPPSDPIQPTDPVQPSQPVQPGSPTAQVAENLSTTTATKNSRAKAVNVDEVITRVVTNEKAAAKKKSAGKGEPNTDVKFKTDLRKAGSKSKNDLESTQDEKDTATKKATKPRKAKTIENELS